MPLLVILVLYWKIYQTARRRIHRRRHHDKPTVKAKAEVRFTFRAINPLDVGQGNLFSSTIGRAAGIELAILYLASIRSQELGSVDIYGGCDVVAWQCIGQGEVNKKSRMGFS